MAKILDGKKMSGKMAEKLSEKIRGLKAKPKLAIIQIGDLAESNTYIRSKIRFAEKVGALTIYKKYPASISETRVVADIKKFNRDKGVHGIMIQLPAPKGFDIETAIESINPDKDVDGLTALNTKRILDGSAHAFIPATTKGIISMLDASRISISGKKIAMVGDSSLVGRPTALALLNRGATVTICHKKTKNLWEETRRADILITAVGKPGLIGKKHVSKNQIILDIGISVLKNGKIAGDADFENIKNAVKAITPVPGGVGPMTVASLIENLVEAYSLQA